MSNVILLSKSCPIHITDVSHFYDVKLEWRRFLFISMVAGDVIREMCIIGNWFESNITLTPVRAYYAYYYAGKYWPHVYFMTTFSYVIENEDPNAEHLSVINELSRGKRETDETG